MADISGDILCRALAAMETIELASYDGFHAYDSYPTQEELVGLEYPHTLHIIRGNDPRVVTLPSGTAEVMIDWVIETYVVVGASINDIGATQEKSAQMSFSYIKGALKHQSLYGLLEAPYNGALVVVDQNQQGNMLQDCGFFFDSELLNMDIVGHKWLVKLTTRQSMTVAP